MRLSVQVRGKPAAVLYRERDTYALRYLPQATPTDFVSLTMPVREEPWVWPRDLHPFFRQNPEAGVYATGHNGFFQSPDGKDWIIYHANSQKNQGCGPQRSPRIQPFTWNPDGTPNFGQALPAGQPFSGP